MMGVGDASLNMKIRNTQNNINWLREWRGKERESEGKREIVFPFFFFEIPIFVLFDKYISEGTTKPSLSYYRERIFMPNDFEELQGTIAPKYIEGVRYEARMTATRHLASFIRSVGATVMIINSLMRITAQSPDLYICTGSREDAATLHVPYL